MKKFIVETYYTCTFKTVHTLDNLNDQELAKIDSRNDGEVEVIDVKLNNRKTKKVGENKKSSEKIKKTDSLLSSSITKEIFSSSIILKLVDLTSLSTRNFLSEVSLFCNFWIITGLLSISKSKYEPP